MPATAIKLKGKLRKTVRLIRGKRDASTNLIQKMPRHVHSVIPPPSSGPRIYEMDSVMPTNAPTTSGRSGPCSTRHTCARLYRPDPPIP